jgi:hypothetical protein
MTKRERSAYMREYDKKRQPRGPRGGDPKKKTAYMEKYRADHPVSAEKHRQYSLKAKHGLTLAEFDAMAARQDGRCAICGTDAPGAWGRLCVDHDHRTGELRGLLCSDCNVAIGRLHDDPQLIRRAAAYLEKWVQERNRG